jgi:CDP-diacylglycerol pyrophosphatase
MYRLNNPDRKRSPDDPTGRREAQPIGTAHPDLSPVIVVTNKSRGVILVQHAALIPYGWQTRLQRPRMFAISFSLRRGVPSLIVISTLIALGTLLFMRRGNPDALWRIISQQCLPNQRAFQHPEPCAKVDEAAGFVMMKDRVGPLQYLLMPVARIGGIEDPVLLDPGTPNYFAQAWQQRHFMADKLGKPIADQNISLAVNSWYGRTQNQLHVHVSCIRSDIGSRLSDLLPAPTEHWSHLPGGLSGHDYLVRRISANELRERQAFRLLVDEVDGARGNMAHFGLAMTALPDGDLLLLATELDLLTLNFASPEEIQDHGCSVLAPK